MLTLEKKKNVQIYTTYREGILLKTIVTYCNNLLSNVDNRYTQYGIHR